jgi:hypothetical protein
VGGGVQTGSTRHVGQLLAYCICPGWLWRWKIWWNEWQGKPKYSEETCPGATLSTTNPTWPDPGLNPDRRGGKPSTNRFSYGAAGNCYTFRYFLSRSRPNGNYETDNTILQNIFLLWAMCSEHWLITCCSAAGSVFASNCRRGREAPLLRPKIQHEKMQLKGPAVGITSNIIWNNPSCT